ncbi:P1 family peptidase [Ornithinimicrobium sp. INDO-MA30-4]|uniref:P1 family peptidase n=1 Tax=Ornithinimicrobium sp. INDO-MA30-4 TaxID=2908651 RepID=UPI0021A3C787|nr:P1 family peptidase [Ornithinimicrobium sp. INDO-MA30-4]
MGSVGAGTGAQAGGLKGGVGSASVTLSDGSTLAALVVVNAVGSPVIPHTGELWGARHLLPGDLDGLGLPDGVELGRPNKEEVEQAVAAARANPTSAVPRTLATTIGVVATDATLTKAQAARLAGSGHDGMARAINPIHTMYDGDTLFGLATGKRDEPSAEAFHEMLLASGEW